MVILLHCGFVPFVQCIMFKEFTYYLVWFAMLQGIVRSLREYQQRLIDNKVAIFVRRAGPNYQEGLRIMRELGESLLLL